MFHMASKGFIGSIRACKALEGNAYGPTEGLCVTGMVMSAADEEVSIGRPLTNYACYVLDTQAQLLPIGMAGELHIGGMGKPWENA